MSMIRTLVFSGAAAFAFQSLSSVACAQTPAPTAARSSPPAASKSAASTTAEAKRSAADAARLEKCKAMTAKATGAIAECRAFATAHPEKTTMAADEPK